jgi:hypothetical protein
MALWRARLSPKSSALSPAFRRPMRSGHSSRNGSPYFGKASRLRLFNQKSNVSAETGNWIPRPGRLQPADKRLRGGSSSRSPRYRARGEPLEVYAHGAVRSLLSIRPRRAFCLQNGLSQHFGHLNQGSPEACCGHYATLTMRILNGVLRSPGTLRALSRSRQASQVLGPRVSPTRRAFRRSRAAGCLP